jgi:predicted transcriptional regulator
MIQVQPFTISLAPLARKRKRVDVSQRQLAAWIGGMTGGCISNYEVGIRSVPLSFIVSAAVALGVPMLDLFEVHAVKGERR